MYDLFVETRRQRVNTENFTGLQRNIAYHKYFPFRLFRTNLTMSFFKYEKHFLGKFGALLSKLGEIKIFLSNLIPSIGKIYEPIINDSKEK